MKKHVLFIHGAGDGAFAADQLLATALQHTLGPAYDVRYPQMPEDDSAAYADWKAIIERELTTLDDQVILVGHSVGASVILKYLSEGQRAKLIGAVFLLATPYWGADDFWTWDEARLPAGVSAKLGSIPPIHMYHSRDDEVVPFAHLVLYRALIPQAITHEVDGRGHQFDNDLTEVAEAIKALEG